jgi:hypothetical protein
MSEHRFESHETWDNEMRGSTTRIPQQSHGSQALLGLTLAFAALTLSVLSYLFLG